MLWRSGRLAVFLLFLMEAAASAAKTHVLVEKLPVTRAEDTEASTKEKEALAAKTEVQKAKLSAARADDTNATKTESMRSAERNATKNQTNTTAEDTAVMAKNTSALASKVECWKGKVGLCKQPPMKHPRQWACKRRVIINTYISRTVELDPANEKDSPLQPFLRYTAAKKSPQKKDIRYVCRREKDPIKKMYDPTNASRHEQQSPELISCLCIGEDLCNMKTPQAQYTFEWKDEYHEWPLEQIYENITKLNQEDFTILSRGYHLKEEELLFPKEPSATVTLELLNCFGVFVNTDILSIALRWDIAHEDTDSAGCPGSPWKWQLTGDEVHLVLSQVEYHFKIELRACAGLLDGKTSWAFLSEADVKRVFGPCDRLQPGETANLQVDYATRGQSMTLRRSDMELRPTPKIRLQCTNHHPPPPPPLGLDELRKDLWIAIAVCLAQVALVAPLLVALVFRLEIADKTVSSIVSLSKDRLSPYHLASSVPGKLIEDFADEHDIDGVGSDLDAARAIANDHRQLQDYNFFGWRTDFDYRAFPWFGKPPEVAAPAKCSCLDCQHAPRVSLSRLFKPARLIEMGLQDWALVDRKDPLYHTFRDVKTEDHLPMDPVTGSKATGSKTGKGNTPTKTTGRSTKSSAPTSYANDTDKPESKSRQTPGQSKSSKYM